MPAACDKPSSVVFVCISPLAMAASGSASEKPSKASKRHARRARTLQGLASGEVHFGDWHDDELAEAYQDRAAHLFVVLTF